MHNPWIKWAVAAVGIFLGLRYFLVPLLPFLIAMTMAVLLEPWVLWCRRRLGFRRKFAAAVLTSAVLLGIVGIFGVVALRLLEQASSWLEQLPQVLARLPRLADQISGRYEGFYSACPADLRRWLDEISDQLSAEGITWVGDLSAAALSWISGVVRKLPEITLFLFTTVLALYFVSLSYPEIVAFCRRQIPDRWQGTLSGVTRCLRTTFWKWIKAESLLCLVTFVLMLLGFWYMGMPYALLAAVLIGLVDALPVLGAGTVLLPWGVFHLLLGTVPRGVALLALYAIISIVRSLLEPRIMAAQAGLPPLTALIAMYVGFHFLGVGGMILLPLLLLLVKQLRDGGFLRLWR